MEREAGPGTVFWLTGLSGAGKTTVGRMLVDRLRTRGRCAALLDGDVLRNVFENDLGHGREDRLKSAMRNARLCGILADQGLDVVCATISLFAECHRWNRENLKRYVEIYLRAPMEVLEQRDQKGLYSGAREGRVKGVVGIDLPYDEPHDANIVIDNDGSQPLVLVVDRICKSIFSTTQGGR